MAIRVAIVDLGLGNLFSVRQACAVAGLDAELAATPEALAKADAAVLPGVGAFADAMDAMQARGLIEPLKAWVAADRPMLGICLGMQLLMDESEEFGLTRGLGLFTGRVRRFPFGRGHQAVRRARVPHMGWNGIFAQANAAGEDEDIWSGTLLSGVAPGSHVYFVHSYYAAVEDSTAVTATTVYGGLTFCSAMRRGRVFACQFHPELSGKAGLRIFENFAAQAAEARP